MISKWVLITCSILTLSFSWCWAQNGKTIGLKDVAGNVGNKVTVEAKVIRVGHSSSNTYFLNFTNEKNGFTAVIPKENYAKFTSAGFNLDSIQGQTISVIGKIENDPKYGLEMILTDPSSQLVIPKSTTSAKTATGIIQASDAAKHAGESGTVEGTVVKVGQSKAGTTFFLNFSKEKNGFTVVVFKSVAEALTKANANPKSFEGKKVQVSGKIVNDPQYGLQIVLDKAESIKIVK